MKILGLIWALPLSRYICMVFNDSHGYRWGYTKIEDV